VLWQFANDAWSVQDYVGIGSGAVAEGGSPASSASNAGQATRRADPEIDSNNNGSDFIVGSAEPRNSSVGVPTIGAIAVQRTNEGESLGPLKFQIADSDTPVDELFVSASSGNTALVPNDTASLELGGAGTDRTITVTPTARANGRTVITITVSDGQYEAATSFQLTVNGRPTIADLSDISILEGTAVSPIGVEVGDAEMSGETVVRVMAANTTSGSAQSYEDPGDRIFQGLKPDVALVQEFNVSTSRYSSIRAWVDANFGNEFHFYREPIAGIPNGIVSRWPILDSGYWDDLEMTNREFTWARIDVPGEKELWAISVHFNAGSSDAASRARQGTALANYIARFVPANDYLLVGGDLNTFSRTESAVTNLANTLVTQGPWPVDQLGNPNSNASRTSPYDWVLAESELDLLETPLDIGSLVFDHGLVFDSRNFSPISLVTPVQRQDSAATNMQHMAVLREFTLPAPASLTVTASSSNQALVRNEDLVIRGTGVNRTIEVTPQSGASGVTTITITVSDGEASRSEQFALTVDAKTFNSWIARTKVPADRRGMSDRNGAIEFANLAAYAMGVDPIEASQADVPKMVAVVGEVGAYLSYSYKRAKLSPGVSAVLEGSFDLLTWLPAEVISEQVSPHSTTREEVVAQIKIPVGKSYFVRLKAVSN
jgi:endonuclease/exonuclease/phosphatase family metal-dependent hydrolase